MKDKKVFIQIYVKTDNLPILRDLQKLADNNNRSLSNQALLLIQQGLKK